MKHPADTTTLGRLHVIVDVTAAGTVGVAPGGDPLELARRALGGGATVLQLRAKNGTDRDVLELAVAMTELCADHGAAMIMDDRVDVALAAGAHGVHVGADDLPVPAARALLGPDRLLGATCRNATDAARAEAESATYLGAGPCYPTTTKAGLPAPIGLTGLREVTAAVDLPVIAIAGVTAARVPELLEAGAYGVAVIGAVAGAADPERATAELAGIIERHTSVGRPA